MIEIIVFGSRSREFQGCHVKSAVTAGNPHLGSYILGNILGRVLDIGPLALVFPFLHNSVMNHVIEPVGNALPLTLKGFDRTKRGVLRDKAFESEKGTLVGINYRCPGFHVPFHGLGIRDEREIRCSGTGFILVSIIFREFAKERRAGGSIMLNGKRLSAVSEKDALQSYVLPAADVKRLGHLSGSGTVPQTDGGLAFPLIDKMKDAVVSFFLSHHGYNLGIGRFYIHLGRSFQHNRAVVGRDIKRTDGFFPIVCNPMAAVILKDLPMEGFGRSDFCERGIKRLSRKIQGFGVVSFTGNQGQKGPDG
jgi:hypothetical protein